MRAECRAGAASARARPRLVLRHRAAGARRALGLRIAEVPVDWVDDPDSRVDVVATALADLRGIARVGRALARGELPVRELRESSGRSPRPVAGRAGRAVPTGAALRRDRVRSARSPICCCSCCAPGRWARRSANLIALLLTAVANTAANRRFTFGIRGPGTARHQLHGLLVFGLGLLLTSGSLWLLAQVDPARREPSS